MTSKLFGQNLALLFVTTFLLAACAGTTDENVATTTSDEPAVAETDDGRPNGVTTDELTEDAVSNLDPYGAANQESLVSYSGDRVFFDYDSAELTGDGRAALQKQADWMNHHRGVTFSIEGHCDERGTREYNLALGERRANAVKNYLIALGVSASRLSTISYGKERPAVVGNGERYWSQNRRGVIVVQ